MTSLFLLFPAAVCLTGTVMFAVSAQVETKCDQATEAVQCVIGAVICAVAGGIAFLFAVA